MKYWEILVLLIFLGRVMAEGSESSPPEVFRENLSCLSLEPICGEYRIFKVTSRDNCTLPNQKLGLVDPAHPFFMTQAIGDWEVYDELINREKMLQELPLAALLQLIGLIVGFLMLAATCMVIFTGA